MLQSAVKKMNLQVEKVQQDLSKADQVHEQLVETQELYERVKMENEVLIDQSNDEVFDVCEHADSTILSMILCQSYVVENIASKSKNK